jgi:hypothetical protein
MQVMLRDRLTTYPKTVDALNGQPLLDNKTSQVMERMSPHFGVMDPNHPFRVSRNVGQPTPVLSTWNHWLTEGDAISQSFGG